MQVKAEAVKDEAKEERAWKKAVWKRDGGKCRWCKRDVKKCLELAPERGECHHVSGRVVKEIRWDRRNGVLVCASCHERLTGKVAEKHKIESMHTFAADGIRYVNADKPIRFVRVA